ncbi:hypothetical protein BIW11_03992 [Tropilaelaps mercedesae]|uniref:Uncharacterized protein n=1 Tax=Tropilaelaps mercedesae TaxID=418985 RepID=A0A1V9XCR2_9ACAR|nr:hypothetical protein BIW11_03992 [Tropilaelaps mercedesae]
MTSCALDTSMNLYCEVRNLDFGDVQYGVHIDESGGSMFDFGILRLLWRAEESLFSETLRGTLYTDRPILSDNSPRTNCATEANFLPSVRVSSFCAAFSSPRGLTSGVLVHFRRRVNFVSCMNDVCMKCMRKNRKNSLKTSTPMISARTDSGHGSVLSFVGVDVCLQLRYLTEVADDRTAGRVPRSGKVVRRSMVVSLCNCVGSILVWQTDLSCTPDSGKAFDYHRSSLAADIHRRYIRAQAISLAMAALARGSAISPVFHVMAEGGFRCLCEKWIHNSGQPADEQWRWRWLTSFGDRTKTRRRLISASRLQSVSFFVMSCRNVTIASSPADDTRVRFVHATSLLTGRRRSRVQQLDNRRTNSTYVHSCEYEHTTTRSTGTPNGIGRSSRSKLTRTVFVDITSKHSTRNSRRALIHCRQRYPLVARERALRARNLGECRPRQPSSTIAAAVVVACTPAATAVDRLTIFTERNQRTHQQRRSGGGPMELNEAKNEARYGSVPPIGVGTSDSARRITTSPRRHSGGTTDSPFTPRRKPSSALRRRPSEERRGRGRRDDVERADERRQYQKLTAGTTAAGVVRGVPKTRSLTGRQSIWRLDFTVADVDFGYEAGAPRGRALRRRQSGRPA